MTLVCSSRASSTLSHTCRTRRQHMYNVQHSRTQCPRLRCLMVAEAFLQPDDQINECIHCRQPVLVFARCRQDALANEPRIMQVWSVSPGGLICERRHWRVGAGCGCRRRHLAYGPSVLLRGAKTNRKHPGHKSSRSSLAVLPSGRGACSRSI